MGKILIWPISSFFITFLFFMVMAPFVMWDISYAWVGSWHLLMRAIVSVVATVICGIVLFSPLSRD